MSTTHWKKTKGLGAIYQALVNNKFFGHSGWRKYLEKEIGYKEKK